MRCIGHVSRSSTQAAHCWGVRRSCRAPVDIFSTSARETRSPRVKSQSPKSSRCRRRRSSLASVAQTRQDPVGNQQAGLEIDHSSANSLFNEKTGEILEWPAYELAPAMLAQCVDHDRGQRHGPPAPRRLRLDEDERPVDRGDLDAHLQDAVLGPWSAGIGGCASDLSIGGHERKCHGGS